MSRRITKLVREGKFAAEISVELIEDETGWSPYLSLDGVNRLDAARLALRDGDLGRASQYGRVFELMPVMA
jgi:hypothetical protein